MKAPRKKGERAAVVSRGIPKRRLSLYREGDGSSVTRFREFFGRRGASQQEIRRSERTRPEGSPEKVARFLRVPKESVYFRRAWLRDDKEASILRFNEFLSREVELVSAFGRSRATYRMACRGAEDGAPFLDAMLFTRWKGRPLALSVGPLDPLYYGETSIVVDVLAGPEDRGLVDDIIDRFFSARALKNKVHKLTPRGSLRQVETPKLTLDEVILTEGARRLLLANTLDLLDKRALYRKNGIPLKRGLILEGAPGNGKTMVCKALAATGRFTVFWVTPTDYSDMNPVYERAVEQAPSIVLFEDIDLLGASRSEHPKVLGGILNAMDGLVDADGVITIATTNDPGSLDKALAHRPNRFDVRIPFANPPAELRAEMLRRFTERQLLSPDLRLDEWARRTEGFSGAQMRELCYLATKNALEAGRTDEKQRAALEDADFASGLEAIAPALPRSKKAGFLHA